MRAKRLHFVTLRSVRLVLGRADHPSEKALVVEDDAGWRSIIEEILNDAGFQVRTCASFGDALGYLRREKLSLAIIDLSLLGNGQRRMG